MELVNFPTWWSINDDRLTHVGTQQTYVKHGSGRALCGDWGRLGNCHVTCDKGVIKKHFQFDPCVQFKEFKNPFYCSTDRPSSENMAENAHLFIAERECALNKYAHLRQIANKGLTAEKTKACKSYVESARRGRQLEDLELQMERNVPISMVYAADTYSGLLEEESLRRACETRSVMYSGGCIKSFVLGGESFVVRCGGGRLSSVVIERLCVEEGRLECVYSRQMKMPVLELDCAVCHGGVECRLLARSEEEVRLLRVLVRAAGEVTVVDMGVVRDTGSWLVSGRLSGLSEEEFMTASALAELSLYDTETLCASWTQTLSADTSRSGKWCWGELSPLSPLKWAHTDSRRCCLLDCRLSRPACTLLSATHPSLAKASETFTHLSSALPGPQLLLLSSYTGSVLDTRMPGLPLSQWSSPLLSPVSYSASCRPHSEGPLTLVLASQLDSKHAVSSQWLRPLTKSSSLLSQDSLQAPSSMSLGVSLLYDSSKQVSTVLSLDSRGRVLCHSYCASSSSAAAAALHPERDTERDTEDSSTVQQQQQHSKTYRHAMKQYSPRDLEHTGRPPSTQQDLLHLQHLLYGKL